MIVTFEYNPKQVKIDSSVSGGIHTGNRMVDGKLKYATNSYGWDTICYGEEEEIDDMTELVEQIIYMVAKETNEAPAPNFVRSIIEKITNKVYPSISMLPKGKITHTL